MSGCRFVSTTEPRVISGRHQDPCACDGERGCLPCPEMHCVVCGREHARAACTACLDAARSDLQAIGDLCLGLPEEAAQKGVQSEAMVLLGPVADPQAWQHRFLAASFFHRFDESYVDDCRDELHPLWILGTWEQVWRDHLDHYSDAKITVASAVAYLDMQIGYMSEQIDPPFDEFARDLRAGRAHLENVLREGIREQLSRVPCVECDTRLTKVYADLESDDHWICPRCRRMYSDQEYARAQHFHLEDERADRFVKVSEALGMIDRPEQTLRTWMANGDVKTERDAKTGAILVWWPDVRDRNRDTPRRKRRSA